MKEFFKNNLDYTEYVVSVPGIKIYIFNKLIHCVIFIGRKKPHRYGFKTKIAMHMHIDKKIKNVYDINEQKRKTKEEEKLKKEEFLKEIKIGDIFRTSWGYNMTLVDFFQVTGKPSPRKFTITPIEKEIKDGGCRGYEGECRGIPDSFFGESKNVQVSAYKSLVNCDEYKHSAYPTDSKSWHHFSHMD